MAHPLRQALLGHLLAAGVQTASECAAAVGSTPSNCSWHLRYLSRFGLVEAVPGSSDDGRERPWRVMATGFSDRVDESTPAGRGARRAMAEARLVEEDRLIRHYLDVREQLPSKWRGIEAVADYELRLTPAEAERIVQQMDALVRPFIAPTSDGAPRGSDVVHVSFRAFKRP